MRIIVQLDAEEVRLQISDNGKGIPEERLRRLREDDSVTGVGMAGMRERVRELGGSFALESASPGTTITVTIPVLTTITVTIPVLQNAELSRDPEEEDSDSIQGASAA